MENHNAVKGFKAEKFKDRVFDTSIKGIVEKCIVIVGTILFLFALLIRGDTKYFSILTPLLNWIVNPEKEESGFTIPEWISIITPILALVMAYLAHRFDEKNKGRGIKDVIKHIKGKIYNLKSDVIASSMTKQSVLAAVIVGLIAIVNQQPNVTYFGKVIKFFTTFGFAFALIVLLVSMICYDYANRFEWGDKKPYQSHLMYKALLLDVFSWYFLLASFLLSLALISPPLSTLASVVSGYLMWYYYFFRPKFKKGNDVFIKSGAFQGKPAIIQDIVKYDKNSTNDPEPEYSIRFKENQETNGQKINVLESNLSFREPDDSAN